MNGFWRMCLNWRVIGAITAVGVAVLLFAPRLAASALPVLFVAICPLSMLLMMRAMQHDRPRPQHQEGRSDETPSREPLAELKAELARLNEQKDALERRIAGLERARPTREDDTRPTRSG